MGEDKGLGREPGEREDVEECGCSNSAEDTPSLSVAGGSGQDRQPMTCEEIPPSSMRTGEHLRWEAAVEVDVAKAGRAKTR